MDKVWDIFVVLLHWVASPVLLLGSAWAAVFGILVLIGTMGMRNGGPEQLIGVFVLALAVVLAAWGGGLWFIW